MGMGIGRMICGRGGIRTHEGIATLEVFRTSALDHYATLPWLELYQEYGLFWRYVLGGRIISFGCIIKGGLGWRSPIVAHSGSLLNS